MTSTPATEVREVNSKASQGPSRPLWAAFKVANAIHCAVFRASRGRLGGRAKDIPIMLLSTTGRRSGRVHTVPVGYIERGDHMLIVGSAGGFSWHPAWYLNLRTNPRVLVELPKERRAMVAEVTEGDERIALWNSAVAAYPVLESYQRKTSREIGVVRLRPVP